MLDGLVIQTKEEYAYPLTPVYTKTEKALDVERTVYYYPNCEVHSVVKYFDPRRDHEHKNPLRVRVHKIMTQFENFLFSQLTLDEISGREKTLLDLFLKMKPEQIYFELIVGWYHTEGWRDLLGYFGKVDYTSDDMVYIRRKVKLAKYNVKGVDFKFYRMNPDENRDHYLKYPYGWMGLTKCEIPTPILMCYSGCSNLPEILTFLQQVRAIIMREKWEQIQNEVGTKTYARSDALYAWSCNDQNLRGTLKIEETELTKREKTPNEKYLETLRQFLPSK